MVKSKKKNKFQLNASTDDDDNNNDIPIKNLPKKCLTMKVNSGSKIRNVLKYSLNNFSKFDGIIWSGAGQAVGKVISCSEIFKTKNKGLHQITKLRFIASKKNKNDDTIARQVPEIFIFLSKNQLDKTETGYQGPDDIGMFQNSKDNVELIQQQDQGQEMTNINSTINAEEFEEMGLRMNLKRSRQERNSKINIK
ncbi:ribonuclease P protein subunit p25-like protein, partial [Aphidius gifuensis]